MERVGHKGGFMGSGQFFLILFYNAWSEIFFLWHIVKGVPILYQIMMKAHIIDSDIL